jgi:Protein of unknown function (DUF2934)
MSRIGTQPQTQFGNTGTNQTGTTTQGSTNTSQTVNNPQLRERVAKRAYEKWLKSGCRNGCDRQNWLEAEAEILAEQNRTGTTYGR